MISAAAWIRKGAAQANPTQFEMTEEQYTEIMSRAKSEIKEAKASLATAKKEQAAIGKGTKEQKISQETSVEDDLAKFNLDTYSDSDGAGEGKSVQSEVDEDAVFDVIAGIDEAALNDEDPYLATSDGAALAADEDEDREDLCIRPSDNLIITCRTEDEVSYLDVYVHDEADENLYVHHDLMLPSFPLCVEWIGAPLVGAAEGVAVGNFAAVGTFEPEIEIWNLDIIETPYPSLILGQETGTRQVKKDKKKKEKKRKIDATRHTDAVMSLSWNRAHQNMLLSGSADSTIKLWDLGLGSALRSFEVHSDKVQTLQWNPSEPSVVGSAAYDRRVLAFDCRMPAEALSWSITADPECLRWNPHDPQTFIVSDEDGAVNLFDMRLGSDSAPLFSLKAHGKPVTCIDWNPAVPDCLMTASADKTIRIWNVKGHQPNCIISREVGVGKIFTAAFCPDRAHLVSAAGSKGALAIVNLALDPILIEAFSLRSPSL